MGLMNLLAKDEPTKVEWVEGGILWDVCNYKIQGIPLAEEWLAQAEDKDLKTTINKGIESLIIPHIEKIQNFLKKEGLEAPQMPNRRLKGIDSKAYPKSRILKDADIANGIRSVYRFGINLDMRLLTYGTRSDINEMAKDIMIDDMEEYINTTKLFYTKNWLLKTPTFPLQTRQ